MKNRVIRERNAPCWVFMRHTFSRKARKKTSTVCIRECWRYYLWEVFPVECVLMSLKFLNILQWLSNGRTIKRRYKNYISLGNCLHFFIILPPFSSIILYNIISCLWVLYFQLLSAFLFHLGCPTTIFLSIWDMHMLIFLSKKQSI